MENIICFSPIKTSLPLKANAVSNRFDVVTTTKLLKSEKIDSLLTLVIPVIMARSKWEFSLNVLSKRRGRVITS